MAKYRKLRPIAAGGMATVYIGKTTGVSDFERVVAIKEMHPHIAQDQGYIDMFMDEARLAARIRHPNVVAVLDVQSPKKGPFIVMDYVEGPTLAMIRRVVHDRGEVIPLAIVLRIICDTLAGLHAAHELQDNVGNHLQLVHRDVSPQNIMVGLDGITRITDFGVARARVRLATTRSGQVKGKLGYLPPEQIEGDHVDRRTDVYAVGVLLWELLTGARLFQAKTEAGLMMKLLSGAKESPRDRNPDVPETLDAACMQALELNIEDRPETAAAFELALEVAAEKADVAIASTRTLASYVADLNIELPALDEPSPGSDPGILDEASDADPSTRKSTTDTTSSSELVAPSAPASGSRWMLALGIAALAAAIVIVVVSSSSRSTDPGPAAGASEQLDAVPPHPTPPADSSRTPDGAQTESTAAAPSASASSPASSPLEGPRPSTSPKPLRPRPPPAAPAPPPPGEFDPTTL